LLRQDDRDHLRSIIDSRESLRIEKTRRSRTYTRIFCSSRS
jgi:hypothetical protein